MRSRSRKLHIAALRQRRPCGWLHRNRRTATSGLERLSSFRELRASKEMRGIVLHESRQEGFGVSLKSESSSRQVRVGSDIAAQLLQFRHL